jgi:murein L,D-transpeptidase YcbB/YkuD
LVRVGLFALLLGAVSLSAAAAPLPPVPAAGSEDIKAALRDLLESEPSVDLDLASVRRFYLNRGFTPVWTGNAARSEALEAAFAAAAEHGLDCGIPAPIAMVAAGRALPGAAEREVAATKAALNCAGALARGRVKPETLETDWIVPAPSTDVVGGFDKALASGDIASWMTALAPQHVHYQRLKTMLGQLRRLAAEGGWPGVGKGVTLKPGMDEPRVMEVRRRLMVEGDVPEESAAGTFYDRVLEEGVKRFQARHGIVVDGAVGPRTLNAMNVPVRARIDQVLINLERWRDMPRDFGRGHIMVNVPAASLDVVEDGTVLFSMKTVVGDKDHPTPVLQTSTAAVVLNPHWSIPSSIWTKEIQPKLRKDRQYLVKNEIVFTPGKGYQQVPGAKNPLGRLKFDTPNRFDVYLHDTPGRNAFDRAARAQSHGCVRVEDARGLAAFLLQNQDWTPESIATAIDLGETQRVELKKRWRVHLFYATAFMAADGTVNFRDDIYGRDQRMREAMLALPSLGGDRKTRLASVIQ